MIRSLQASYPARSAAARRIRFARGSNRPTCPSCGAPLRIDPTTETWLEHNCPASLSASA